MKSCNEKSNNSLTRDTQKSENRENYLQPNTTNSTY